jgi:uncharacterized protein (DUF1800 family)
MGKRSNSRNAIWTPHVRSIAIILLLGVSVGTLAWASPDPPEKRQPPLPAGPTPAAPSRGKNENPRLPFAGKLPITELDEQEAILHALNRLGFGPRPGEVEQIEKSGLENWIRSQLHPDLIPDTVVNARLAEYPALRLSATNFLEEYPQPDVVAKKLGITQEDYQARLRDSAKAPNGGNAFPYKDQQEIVNDSMAIKMIRAVYSDRQLNEQLTDFWFNHFNVFIYKDLDRWYMIPYERDAIRAHVLGGFRDLLEATAKSPAMLFYLDNFLSGDPNTAVRLKQHPIHTRPGVKLPPFNGKPGLNENYGRELLELHTLGVDGGYTQKDVVEVARSFTGWTIKSPRDSPQFYFDDRLHDPNPKRVLGKVIHAGGMKDGEQVLDLLVKDRHTAHHISLQLAQHFVSDDPPEALVQRMTKTFEKSRGDIRAVMTTMIYSPEFWSRTAFRAKVKTPFELVASTVRALGGDMDQPLLMAQWVVRIGEPLYQCVTPNGYADKASAWISTGSLLNRMNFAVAVSNNNIRGTRIDLNSLVGSDDLGNPKVALDRVETEFLAGQVSDTTRETLDKETTDPQIVGAKLDDPVRKVNLSLVTGLVLGSPEFQKR